MMKLLDSAFLLLLVCMVQYANGQTGFYTKKELSEDITYLKAQLLDKHPNIHIYSPESAFQSFFETLDLPEKALEQEAYGIISKTSSIIKDGHTLFYPDVNRVTQNNIAGRFLPLGVFWDDAHLFVTDDYSPSKEPLEGQKIISINGLPAEEIVHQMLEGMMRDGNSYQYPTWVINNFFFEYYSYFYGCPLHFELVLEDSLGQLQEIKIDGAKKSDLLQKIKQKKEESAKGVYLELDLPNNTAILTIKDWHNNLLKKYYGQKFKPEIKQIMSKVGKSEVKNLIIDVRNNQGGDTENSRLLLSYLLDTSFELVEGYKTVKAGKLSAARGPQQGLHEPQKEGFKGKVFVLTNGGSFSNTAIFCSVLRKFNRATFIGEETGGSEYVICGGTKTITLPNTKIRVVIPTLQFLIKDYSNATLSGIRPDHEVKPTVQNLIERKDVVMEYAMELIKTTR